MLILPDLTTPDLTAKPDLKSLFLGPLTLTFQLNYVIFFSFKIFIQALIQFEINEKHYNRNRQK